MSLVGEEIFRVGRLAYRIRCCGAQVGPRLAFLRVAEHIVDCEYA